MLTRTTLSPSPVSRVSNTIRLFEYSFTVPTPCSRKVVFTDLIEMDFRADDGFCPISHIPAIPVPSLRTKEFCSCLCWQDWEPKQPIKTPARYLTRQFS